MARTLLTFKGSMYDLVTEKSEETKEILQIMDVLQHILEFYRLDTKGQWSKMMELVFSKE
jgi:hypothetical protein